jgi:beta-1,4-mannosyltransferase
MADARLSVLESFPIPRATTNPYLIQLANSIASEPDMELATFSWKTALFGYYDVFHLHWPEVLVRGTSPLKSFVRRALTRVLLGRLKTANIPLVRTIHNIETHEAASRAESRLLARIDRAATARILLTSRTPVDPGGLTFVIPHGHYRGWFADQTIPDAVPGRLVYAGLIRPYKGVLELIATFIQVTDPALTLVVAGKISPPQLKEQLIALASTDSRVTLVPRFLSDTEIAEIVGSSSLVVLPYREMHNSGAALLALSLDRPVLVPRNNVTADLSEEVGPGWVTTINGKLSPETLGSALSATKPLGRPNLTAREWGGVGKAHHRVFAAAIDAAAKR